MVINLPIKYDEVHWSIRRSARNQYVIEQKGKCWYCAADLYDNPPTKIKNKRINTGLFPPNFFKYPVHLHHDRKTGLTVGAVHSICNAVLWIYHGE